MNKYTIAFISTVTILLALTIIGLANTQSSSTVAIIPIENIITTQADNSLFATASTSSTDVVNWIEQANKNQNIKAILLEINSPGGSAVASDEISQALNDVDKPVIAWIRESGASGAYWIASSSDHIIANRMSITGSVGVVASYIGFSEFFEEYNLTYNQLSAGERKELISPFIELEEEQQAIMQEKLDTIHDIFLEEVRTNRNLSQEQYQRVRTGEFFLGIEAYELGLVDELGVKSDVETYLEEELNSTIRYQRYSKDRGFFEGAMGLQSPQLRIEAR